MRYILGFVSIFIGGYAPHELEATIIGSAVKTSVGTVSGITRDGGVKEYMELGVDIGQKS